VIYQFYKAVQTRIVTKDMSRVDVPFAKPFVRQYIPLAQVVNVDELANHGMSQFVIAHIAIVPQPAVQVAKALKELPVDALVGRDCASQFLPNATGIYRIRMKRFIEIFEYSQSAIERIAGCIPLIAETGIEPDRKWARNDQEWNRILIPYFFVDFARFSLRIRLANIYDWHIGLRLIESGGVEQVNALETALILRLPENVAEVAIFLQGFANEEVRRIAVAEQIQDVAQFHCTSHLSACDIPAHELRYHVSAIIP
jgi:hypothetical protein